MRFDDFMLDLRAGLLSRNGTPIAVRPKTFAVLQHLVRHAGELISKQGLLDAVWGDVAVTDDMPRLSIGELRRALGDDRRAPTLIVTVPRRGYRFIAPVEPVIPRTGGWTPGGLASASAPGRAPSPTIAGREHEHGVLESWLRDAVGGTCRVGVVTGEIGIGKTTLIEAFLDRQRAPASTAGRPGLRVAWGECLEQHGEAEPHLAVLQALRRLACSPDAEGVRMTLRRWAPASLLRALGLLEPGDEPPGGGAEPVHSLRLLGETLAAISIDAPVILVLEDLQWSSYPTVDLLNLLAHRRELARLLVLGTLRESDAMVRRHPVMEVSRELHRRGLCGLLPLTGLSEAEVGEYLARRLPGDLPRSAPRLLLERSEGNPLFLTALVDDLVARGVLRREQGRWTLGVEGAALEEHVPEGLLAAVEPHLERVSAAERRVLEAASVAGVAFAAHVIAAVLGEDIEVVEKQCDALTDRHQLLRRVEPDDQVSGRYAFRHALHRQVVRQRMPASRRRRLEQTITEQVAAGQTTCRPAAEGRDPPPGDGQLPNAPTPARDQPK